MIGRSTNELPPWDAAHYWPPDATSILDVGCNVGTALQRVYESGIRNLYGVEINRHAVATARARLAKLPGVNPAHIVHGSAETGVSAATKGRGTASSGTITSPRRSCTICSSRLSR